MADTMFVDIIVPTKEEGRTWLIIAIDSSSLPENKKVGRIFRDSLVAISEEGQQVIDNRLTFRLVEGTTEELKDAIKIVVKGLSYRVLKGFKNIYELENYGILAWVTKDFLIHPCLRKAHFLEKQANGSGIGSEDNFKTWPIIVPLNGENENDDNQPF